MILVLFVLEDDANGGIQDNCCKLVHPPNAVDEKTREILEKSKAQAGFKPKTKTGGE